MNVDAEWSVEPDPTALAGEAARRFVEACRDAIAERERFVVALSGGSTPRALFGLLAREPYRDTVDWSRVHIAWGDERCAPPDHPESNYRMAREALLDHVAVPPDHIHRIPAELPDPDAAARAYEATLRSVFAGEGLLGDVPRFDLIQLGLGVEGHTASLFPGSPALLERSRLVAAPFVEQVGAYRITLTLPVLNAARQVHFLVAGAQKSAILCDVRRQYGERTDLPAAMVRPVDGRLVWLVDREAAAHLDEC